MAESLLVLAQAAGGPALNWVFLLGMVAVMYFLIFRPQQKAAKAHRDLIAGLKKGDDVVTSGGMLGKIHAVAEREVQLEIANGVRVRVLKTAIQARRGAEVGAEPAKSDAASGDAAEKKEQK